MLKDAFEYIPGLKLLWEVSRNPRAWRTVMLGIIVAGAVFSTVELLGSAAHLQWILAFILFSILVGIKELKDIGNEILQNMKDRSGVIHQ